MVNSGTLFDLPLLDWSYELVDDFLKFGRPEDDFIEYKGKLEQRQRELFADTLGAMANGEGGWIFVGVTEETETKMPKGWPLLDADRDYTRDIFNLVNSYITPLLRPQVRALRDPESGKQLLVVYVPQGSNPPYVVRERGVRVRVGDQDRVADRATLDRLYQRRRDPNEAQAEQRSRFVSLRASIGAQNPTVLDLYMAPLLGGVRLIPNEQTAGRCSDIAAEHVFGRPVRAVREIDGLHFGDSAQLSAWMRSDGSLILRENLGTDGTGASSEPVSFNETAQLTTDFLRLGTALYSEVLPYPGELYVAASIVNLNERPIRLVGSIWSTNAQPRRSQPRRLADWLFDGVTYHAGAAPLPTVKAIFHDLYFQADYDGITQFLNAWGEHGR